MSEDQAVSAPAVDVAALRAALSRATPGPWIDTPGRHAWRTVVTFDEGKERDLAVAIDVEDPADAELIVLLRNNAEALLDALAEAERRGAVKALRDLPDHLKPNMSLVAQIDARADAIENGGDH